MIGLWLTPEAEAELDRLEQLDHAGTDEMTPVRVLSVEQTQPIPRRVADEATELAKRRRGIGVNVITDRPS